MSISFGGDRSELMLELNTTPLIDVMLVLLIMFIITVPIATHAVNMQLPRGGGQVQRPISLEVDFDGSVFWEGRRVEASQLAEHFRHEAAIDASVPVAVTADRRAPYESVVQVLAAAQRNGMKQISLTGDTRTNEN